MSNDHIPLHLRLVSETCNFCHSKSLIFRLQAFFPLQSHPQHCQAKQISEKWSADLGKMIIKNNPYPQGPTSKKRDFKNKITMRKNVWNKTNSAKMFDKKRKEKHCIICFSSIA